ncbi:DUF4097 family beta strand repeat-containing protein [Kitasatospora sp. NPDC054939]
MKRVLGALAITGTVLLGTAACVGEDADQEKVDRYGVSEAVSALVVEGRTGPVVVKAGGDVQVVEKKTYKGEAPKTTHAVKDGTLTLTYPDCKDCGVAYEVTVPAGTKVAVKTGTGDVKLVGLAGEVAVKTGTGVVEGTDLGSQKAEVTTGTGGINVAFKASPVSVVAKAETGDVQVKVPSGESYKVDANAATGGEKVDVPRNDGSSRSISARAETGRVTVTGG